jgi:uncharacterized membrane protein YuzA (DUF378 family)
LVLVIIGAINWGLIGFFQFDLVASIFGGQDSALSRIIYGLVGLSGLACIPLLFQSANATESDTAGQSQSTRQSYTQPSYGTEFSEENDLTNINEKVKRSDNPNDQM